MLYILIALFVLIGVEWFISFMGNHSYYGEMVFSGKHFTMILSMLLCAYFPIYYLQKAKTPSFLGLGLRLWGGLVGFSFLHAWINGTLLGFWALLLQSFNVALLYTLGVSLIFLLFVLWNFIVRKLRLFKTIRWQETLLTFGIGLVVFLVLMQILMGVGVFRSRLLWIIVAGLAVLSYWEIKHLKPYTQALGRVFIDFQALAKNPKIWWIIVLLALCSVGYFYFGFDHSYIPYPTARDANHEYMYTPKVIAEHGGILRGNAWAASAMPYLWHGFIAFAFSFFAPLTKFLNIAKDSFAVIMNFWSWVFVLVLGIGLLKEILTFFRKPQKDQDKPESVSQTSFMIWWGLLILWLTSGMGAFLLFVDNKTDMGVLALTVFAILAGITALNHFQEKTANASRNATPKYLIISAVFFAFATMAKPTAFIDIVIFWLLLLGILTNALASFWAGILVLWAMGILQPLFTAAFISPALGKILIIIGGILFLIGIVRGFIKKQAHFGLQLKNIFLWGICMLVSMLIFKWPWVLIRQVVEQNQIKPAELIQSIILGQASSNLSDQKDENSSLKEIKPLLAQQTGGLESLETQRVIDSNYLNQATSDLNYHQCKSEKFDEADLTANLQKAPGSASNEDFGRYIGFGRRAFPKTGVSGLILRLFFWKDNACYGLNADAVLLCENTTLLENLAASAQTESSKNQISTSLSELKSRLRTQDGKVATLIQNTIDAISSGTHAQIDTTFDALQTYGKEHSISTDNGNVNIPYRYIVPLNAIYNWSLQNLSSYYTDIGLIWIFVLILLVAAAIYALFARLRILLILSLSIISGWAIWWAIAAGILWYGLGLIIWSILAVMIFIEGMEHKDTAKSQMAFSTLIWILTCFILVQSYLNWSRISSQAGSWAFGWYKSNVWTEQILSENLEVLNQKTYKFTADKLFELQFGAYLPFMKAVENRADEDWVLVAGTYIQYFLKNQRNMRSDGLLTMLWEQFSDFNSCKSYNRLKNKHIKYLIIDPNIGTVGRVGQGNESLFHRFFAKLNTNETEILAPGAISMLAKFSQEGYLKLLFTNNIGAKYWFEVSDAELRKEFWNLSDDQLLLIRAKMIVAKFFVTQEDMSLLTHIFNLFLSRYQSAAGIDDMANLVNKQVDSEKLFSIAAGYISNGNLDAKNLTQDERFVLVQYLSLLKTLSRADKSEFENILFSALQSSIFGSSQIISLELQ